MTQAEEGQLSEDQPSEHPAAEGVAPTAEGPAPTAEGAAATAEGPAAQFDLGLSLAEQGDQAGARAAFQRVIDSGDPICAPAALRNLGVLLEGQGDEAGARAAFQTTIDDGDAEQAPAAAYGLGLLLEGQGDQAGARAAFQTVIDSDHSEYAPAASRNLGMLLEGQGDQAGARAAFQAAIDSGDAEQSPAAAVNLGMLLVGQGDLAGAGAAFQNAIDSEHVEFAPVAELLMGEHCMTGDPQARIDHRLRAAAWANPDVLLSLAELHLVERDNWTGRQFLVRAATAGMAEAMEFLKLFPRDETGSADEQTLQDVSTAAEAGDTDSMNVLGVHASLLGDVDLAISWWTRSAAEGDAIAPLLIAIAPSGDTGG